LSRHITSQASKEYLKDLNILKDLTLSPHSPVENLWRSLSERM